MKNLRLIGETTITGKNQISLPAQGLRELGWKKGDHLQVDVLGDNMVILIRRPDDVIDAFAGRLGHVFGTHEEVVAYLEEERGTWDSE